MSNKKVKEQKRKANAVNKGSKMAKEMKELKKCFEKKADLKTMLADTSHMSRDSKA